MSSSNLEKGAGAGPIGSTSDANAFPSTSRTNSVVGDTGTKPHHHQKTELDVFQTLVGIRFL